MKGQKSDLSGDFSYKPSTSNLTDWREATGKAQRAKGTSAAQGLTGVPCHTFPSAGGTPRGFISASFTFLNAMKANLSTSKWLSIPRSSCWLILDYLATLWTNH